MYDPCYTCKRRRIQCDQSQTPCKKCLKAGLECYDKRPLRWVKGVAIRGRLQGVAAKDASTASTALATLDRVSGKKGSKKIISSALVKRDQNDHTGGSLRSIELHSMRSPGFPFPYSNVTVDWPGF